MADNKINILPNNPMRNHGLLDHLKQVKGDMGWYEFNLRTLTAAYPKDTVFAEALKVELAEQATKAAKVTPATDATTAKAEAKPAATKAATGTKKADKATTPAPAPKATTGNTKGKKTAAQVKAANAKAAKGEPKEKGDSLPPTVEELEELASIGI